MSAPGLTNREAALEEEISELKERCQRQRDELRVVEREMDEKTQKEEEVGY